MTRSTPNIETRANGRLASELNIPSRAVIPKVRTPRSLCAHSRSNPAKRPIPTATPIFAAISRGGNDCESGITVKAIPRSEHTPSLLASRVNHNFKSTKKTTRRFPSLRQFRRGTKAARPHAQEHSGTADAWLGPADRRFMKWADGGKKYKPP